MCFCLHTFLIWLLLLLLLTCLPHGSAASTMGTSYSDIIPGPLCNSAHEPAPPAGRVKHNMYRNQLTLHVSPQPGPPTAKQHFSSTGQQRPYNGGKSEEKETAVFTDCGSNVSLLQICLGPPKAEGGRESSQTVAFSAAWQIHLCTDIIKATRLPFHNAL